MLFPAKPIPDTCWDFRDGAEHPYAARSLSDPPAPGETIRMNLTVNGNVLGNRWDATPHLVFSKTRDSFTDGQHIRRNITVTMISAPWPCIEV